MTTASDEDPLGPVETLVVCFPDGRLPAAGFGDLLAQVDSGALRVLDLELVRRTADGQLRRVSLAEVDHDPEVEAFAGASSDLLDDEDLAVIGADLPEGVAAVVVYEVLVLVPAVHGWTAAGATVVDHGRVEVGELLAALDRSPGKED